MKKLSITIVCLLVTMMAFAQEGPMKFSPEKFKADLQEFIVKEAKLTPQEAAKFLPLFGEMHGTEDEAPHRRGRLQGCHQEG